MQWPGAERFCGHLEQVRDNLLKPTTESLEASLPLLQEVVGQLQLLRASLGQGVAKPAGGEAPRAELRKGLEAARDLSGQISRLLHQAGKSELEWGRMLLASHGGYKQDGAETDLRVPPTMRAEG